MKKIQDLIEFSSNISLKLEDQGRYQLAYVTQLYGTMFGVFAKPNCKYIIDKNKKIESAKIVDFKFVGVNYKGFVNLELCRERDRPIWMPKPDPEPDPDQALIVDPPVGVTNGENNGIQLDLWLKASLGGLPGTIKEMEVCMPIPGDLPSLKYGDYIRIERKLLPFAKHESDKEGHVIRDAAFCNGMFDSEYFSRDGLFVKTNPGTDPLKGIARRNPQSSLVLNPDEGARIVANPVPYEVDDPDKPGEDVDTERRPDSLDTQDDGPGSDTLQCTPANLKCFL